MLRHLVVTTTFALAALATSAVQAAEAGKVIFVAGASSVAERPATEGGPVQEGDMLVTGTDGFIYIKTIDNGLFILRPNTKARIVTYHVDAKDPGNTRIKLELLSGVARSRSGEAVKLARQNFRFNTPVAAIGVRGTDFTVFTDQNTSSVSVISGGITMSGFAGACRPEGGGPCEGTSSRELSATQRGQLLQMQRGQAAPQLLMSGSLTPDQLAPPRGDEPIGKAGTSTTGSTTAAVIEPSLDAKKTDILHQAQQGTPIVSTPVTTPPPVIETAPPPAVVVAPPVVVDPPVVVAPPVVVPPPAVVVPPPVVVVPPPVDVPVVPERTIVWGRWQPLIDQPAKIDLVAETARSEQIGIIGNYALFRTAGKDYVAADHGSIGFSLKDSDAVVYTDTAAGRATSAATLNNGELNVDFGKKTFNTSVNLNTNVDVVKLTSQGVINSSGRMFGEVSLSRIGVMNLTGVLSNENGGAASYIFDAKLDATRTANGATYWGH